jgi:hypothetical protein
MHHSAKAAWRATVGHRPMPERSKPRRAICEKGSDSDVIEQHGRDRSSRHAALLVVPRQPADQAQREYCDPGQSPYNRPGARIER